MDNHDITVLQHRLETSVAYNGKRVAIWANASRLVDFVSFLASSAAVFALIGSEGTTGLVLAGVAAALQAFNVATRPAERASHHRDLRAKFLALEADFVLRGEHVTGADAARFHRDIRIIEQDEPAPLRVLNTICHNEWAERHDRQDEVVPVTAWQEFLAPFVDWRPSTLKRLPQE